MSMVSLLIIKSSTNVRVKPVAQFKLIDDTYSVVLPTEVLGPHPSSLSGTDSVELLPRSRQSVPLHQQHIPERVKILGALQPELTCQPRSAISAPSQIRLVYSMWELNEVLGSRDRIFARLLVSGSTTERFVGDLVRTCAEELKEGVCWVLLNLFKLCPGLRWQ